MAAPHDHRVRLLAALYARFGEAASWQPVAGGAALPCIVRRRTSTAEVNFGDSAGLMAANLLKVRAAEVAAPEQGDTVTVTLGGGGAATFEVLGDPVAVKSELEWVCEVRKTA